jgi:hypothetical protein
MYTNVNTDERLTQLETIQPITDARVEDHETRLRAVEVSIAKISVYVSLAATGGSILGAALVRFLF